MRLIEFRYRSTGSDDAFLRRFQYTCPKGRVLDHHWQPQSHIVFTGSVIVAVPEELESADIRVGLGAGKPTDLLHTDVTFAPAATQPTLRSNIPPATSRAIETDTVRFGEILYENGDIEVELFDRRTPEQRDQASGNLCVITRSGKPMHWTGFANHDDKFFYAFTLQKQQIAAVVFQSRDYLWMTLPNVPLRAKTAATTPQ
jgi:hypothetical protein